MQLSDVPARHRLATPKQFPTSVRALGVGLPYAVGNALFGGTAEYAALYLRSLGMEEAYFYYVATVVGRAFIAAMVMPNLKTHGYLDGDGEIEKKQA